MPIKVWEATFRLCKSLNPKLRDYNTRMGSWLPTLAATTNQPSGMHFGHVHVLAANSPCLLPLLAPRFLLAPPRSSILIWAYAREFHLSMPLDNPFLIYSLCLWCNFLEVWKLSLYFTCNLMWYICVTFHPTKRKVMSSSCFMFLLLLCRFIVEFFYGFLGMFHVKLIHPRCLYWMVSFPLDQVLPLSPP